MVRTAKNKVFLLTKGGVVGKYAKSCRPLRRLSENGYFPQSRRQAQVLILEILQCIPVVKIFAFLDLGKNLSFSDSLLSQSTLNPR
jgi:hypothetical protein